MNNNNIVKIVRCNKCIKKNICNITVNFIYAIVIKNIHKKYELLLLFSSAPLPIKHCNSSSWPGVMGPAANQKPHTSLQANGVSRTLPLHSPSSPIMGPSVYVTCLLPPLTPPPCCDYPRLPWRQCPRL